MFGGVFYESDIYDELCHSCQYLNQLSGYCSVTGCINPKRFDPKVTIIYEAQKEE